MTMAVRIMQQVLGDSQDALDSDNAGRGRRMKRPGTDTVLGGPQA